MCGVHANINVHMVKLNISSDQQLQEKNNIKTEIKDTKG